MKLNVEKKFKDKITGEIHKIGDVIECDIERAKELLADKRKLVSKNEDDLETATVKPVDVEIPEKTKAQSKSKAKNKK